MDRPKNIKDRTGLRYNRWVVISYAGSRLDGRSKWLCRCDCGKEKTILLQSLHRSESKSCGCLAKENRKAAGIKLRKGYGEALFGQLFASYKRSAKRRNYEFDITKEHFRCLTKQSCYYCGIEPYRTMTGKWLHGHYTYNGVDRYDNTKGYTLENSKTCCFKCNKAKGIIPGIEWEEHITKCYLNLHK